MWYEADMAGTQQNEKWTTKRLLEWTSDYLGKAGVEEPRLCSELLLADVLKWQRIDLYVKFDHCPEQSELGGFRDLVRRCAGHEPIGYLTGKAHFYGLEFEVGPAVLIPRPETEVLVEQGIKFLRQDFKRPRPEVLDLCTGSGCVAVAIGVNVIEAEVVGSDKSGAALEVAGRNAARHEVEGRVSLVESDLFGEVSKSGKCLFDLITANPPYINARDYAKLDANVRHEPPEALLGGEDGLDVVRRIIAEGGEFLAEGGAMMLEVGYDQGKKTAELMTKSGYLGEVRTIKDFQGYERVVAGRKV